MEELINILKGLHQEVDYDKEDKLIDNMILDSFLMHSSMVYHHTQDLLMVLTDL